MPSFAHLTRSTTNTFQTLGRIFTSSQSSENARVWNEKKNTLFCVPREPRTKTTRSQPPFCNNNIIIMITHEATRFSSRDLPSTLSTKHFMSSTGQLKTF